MNYLPETKNDFIFAVIGEPWSLLLVIAAGVFGFFMVKRHKNR